MRQRITQSLRRFFGLQSHETLSFQMFKRKIAANIQWRFDYINNIPPSNKQITISYVPLWKRKVNGWHEPVGVFVPALYILAKHQLLRLQKEQKANFINPLRLALLPTFRRNHIAKMIKAEYHYQREQGKLWPQFVSKHRIVPAFLKQLTQGKDSPYILAEKNSNLSREEIHRYEPTELALNIRNVTTHTTRFERYLYWLLPQASWFISGAVVAAGLPLFTSFSLSASLALLPFYVYGAGIISHALAERELRSAIDWLTTEIPWLMSPLARKGNQQRQQMIDFMLKTGVIVGAMALVGIGVLTVGSQLALWGWFPTWMAAPLKVLLPGLFATTMMIGVASKYHAALRQTHGLSPYDNTIPTADAENWLLNLEKTLKFEGTKGHKFYDLMIAEREQAFEGAWILMRDQVHQNLDAVQDTMTTPGNPSERRHSPRLSGTPALQS